MKKILLGIIVIMAVFSMILPSVSYGICNTIKFNKQIRLKQALFVQICKYSILPKDF